MSTDAPAQTGQPSAGGDAIFSQVIVGIDETPESLVATAQAGVLRAPNGRLVLLAVSERHLAAHAGLAATSAEDHLYAGTAAELAYAKELVEPPMTERLTLRKAGRAALRRVCVARDGTLIADRRATTPARLGR